MYYGEPEKMRLRLIQESGYWVSMGVLHWVLFLSELMSKVTAGSQTLLEIVKKFTSAVFIRVSGDHMDWASLPNSLI